MSNLEGDMINDMLQAALNLDVDTEVEKRINMARQMIESGKYDESLSRSGANILKNGNRSSKKNVTFQSPDRSK